MWGILLIIFIIAAICILIPAAFRLAEGIIFGVANIIRVIFNGFKWD